VRLQLTRTKSIRPALATITAALLGTGVNAQSELTKVESSLLLYSETDRVKCVENVTGLTWKLKGDRSIGVKFTFDGLTGASPSGATPSRGIQTFTRASGQGSYSVSPGTIPLDNTFSDARIALDGSFSQPLSRLIVSSFGAHYSGEHDYSSFGINTGLTLDLFRKNTTLGVSGALSHDLVSPKGGAPVPFATLVAGSGSGGDGEGDGEGGSASGPSKTKNVFDAVFSFTQILDRNTLVRFNYSYSRSSGYLNDPYKILSVVQDPGDIAPGEPVRYIYEARPDLRVKQAFFGEIRRYIHGNTIDLSYRYFWDDWGTTAHTTELSYRQQLGGGYALKPHVRWYRQSKADFYNQYLMNGQLLPQYASADYRLGEFDASTYGLQFIMPVGERTHFNLAAEFYQQTGKRGPPEAFGTLREFKLFPDMKALMIRAGFTLDF
jgi:hypothetical protein